MSLYLLINVLSIAPPLLLSFDRRVHFHTSWKYLFPAIAITLLIFVIWDIIFTAAGVWSFNETYHSSLEILGLPLEEYLFFITIPYASIFTIHVLAHYFPGFRLNRLLTRLLSYTLIAALLLVAVLHIGEAYTAVSFIFAALVIGLVLWKSPSLLARFYPAYLVILIPFGFVNGLLTGSFIEDQVVWYNDQENLGIRLGTIPLEDLFYGMSLILLVYFLSETFRSRWERKTKSE